MMPWLGQIMSTGRLSADDFLYLFIHQHAERRQDIGIILYGLLKQLALVNQIIVHEL